MLGLRRTDAVISLSYSCKYMISNDFSLLNEAAICSRP